MPDSLNAGRVQTISSGAISRPADAQARPAPATAAPLQAARDGVDSAARARAERSISAGPAVSAATPPRPRGNRQIADPSPTMRSHMVGTIRQREPVAGAGLFVDGVSPRDIMQGQAGTCWFLAAVASMAHSRPQVIRDLIRDNGDGTYTVRFHRDGGGRHEITVDDDLASYGNRPVNARSPDARELWVSIVEKAYAQMYGSYGRIEAWHAAEAMRLLGGRGGRHISTWASTEQLFREIRAAERDKRTMAANISYFGGGNGLTGFHVYTVLGAVEEGGQRYVIMRDPWGNQELRGMAYRTDIAFGGRPASPRDGIFRIRIEDFRQRFSNLTVES